MHHPVQHQVRNLTHVPAILELAQILRKVLRTDVNVRSANAALQHVPEALDVVHRGTVGADIFLLAVDAGLVAVAAQ